MMWNPSHVQILVRSAKDLKIKGNDGTNDAFVTIDLGHSKFQTSVKPGSTNFVEWFELCEMKLPKQSNNQTLTLTAYHKNLLSTDQFLGTVSIPFFMLHECCILRILAHFEIIRRELRHTLGLVR